MDKDINRFFSIKDKVAIITGASRGIGAEIAKLFARAGAKLVICSRKLDSVTATAAAIEKDGGQVMPVAANIFDPDDRENLVKKALGFGGRLDILVNNAGANPAYCGLAELPEAAFDKVVGVNLKATLFLSQLAYHSWMKENGGTILNVSSIGGFQPSSGINGYNVIKAALNHLTRCLASEWGHRGIRINALAPGVIKTDFSKALWDDPKFAAMMQRNPIPRFGEVTDLSGAALFMVSEAAGYITGQTLVIDGGTLIAG